MGTLVLGVGTNSMDGIRIENSVSNIIGGNTAIERNIISGNLGNGINIMSNSNTNLVKGNYIGLANNGILIQSNVFNGILIQSGSTGNIIGGSIVAERNVISGNSSNGLHILNTTANTIKGNYVGLSALGTAAKPNAIDGIKIETSTFNTIGGTIAGERNVISGNTMNGINLITNSDNNQIKGNYIGINSTSTGIIANGQNGVVIQSASTNNTIGGSLAGEGNNISGNSNSGIYILNTTGNFIRGNAIGIDVLGTLARPNTLDGIRIETSTNNIIGGSTALERNIISGNNANGINFMVNSNNNSVRGNYIGLRTLGTLARANAFNGIIIQSGSTNNIVGGSLAGEGNAISGNSRNGIHILNTTTNIVRGNYIGLIASGAAVFIANTMDGIRVENSTFNTIGGVIAAERNVISGNVANGINLMIDSTNNNIKGNYIGLDAVGLTGVQNTQNGILAQSGSNFNIVGGSNANEGNTISWNFANGIYFLNTTSNIIRGNYIGIDAGGTIAKRNNQNGIKIESSTFTTIGGITAFERNVISANTVNEVNLLTNSDNNTIKGNYIGTNAAGTAALGIGKIVITTSSFNMIGGSTVFARNIIQGGLILSNADNNSIKGNYTGTDVSGGVLIGIGGIGITNSNNTIIGGVNVTDRNIIAGGTIGISANSSGTIIQQNYIGTDVGGTINFGGPIGISIASSNLTLIGGSAATKNIIVAKANTGIGIDISGTSANTIIRGNFIGTNATGTAALATMSGIQNGGIGSIIGGTNSTDKNIISGCTPGFGITCGGTGFVIQGNYIGTDVTGTFAIPNGIGISVSASNETIGGTTVGAGNLISGNFYGVEFWGSNNLLVGNLIGVNFSGISAIPNNDGVVLSGGPNFIGTSIAGARNSISGNNRYGILIQSKNNIIKGNFIGTDITGNASIPNNSDGIFIRNDQGNNTPSSNNIIGGIFPGEGNIIANNKGDGINVTYSNTNQIRRNSIYCNNGKGINLNYLTPFQGNNGHPIPAILSANGLGANGTALAGDTIELYYGACNQNQRKLYIATVITNALGLWSYVGTLVQSDCLVATSTSIANNTSEFSNCSNDLIILPIELLNFEGNLINGIVELKWITANEQKSGFYSIERSKDATSFEEIGKVKAAGTSLAQLVYSFIDESPLSGISYYRLKIVNIDGTYSYSKIIDINIFAGAQFLKIYPNPINDKFFIELKDAVNLKFSLFDLAGNEIQRGLYLCERADDSRLVIDISLLSSGMYFFKLEDGNEIIVKKIVKE